MSALDPRTPVLVGVGQITHRGDDLVDPITLAAEATRRALADCGADLDIDTVAMPGVLAPNTEHPAHRLSAELGLSPRRLLSSTIGGNTPQWLVGKLGADIVDGRCDVALVAGAEAGAAVRRARKQGVPPRTAAEATGEDTEIGDTRMGASAAELHAGLGPPPFLYPILESAVAHHAGRSLDEQRRFLGNFMAPATEVAASHPDLAWFPSAATPEELSEPTPANRMIAEPYTKRMNAIIEVDQAAAFLLCSVETAQAAGIPRDRWVFPLGVADLNDVFYPLERPDLHRSPAIETAGRALFDAVGRALDDVSRFDFYSCFPVAVEISAMALGLRLDDPRPLTVTGGHAYFGGPGNNYTTHSIGTMAEQLREDPGAIGLTTGLGWYVTKHSIGLWSTTPPERGFATPDLSEAQAAIDDTALAQTEPGTEVGATVDGWTVIHDRDAGPVSIVAYATTAAGERVVVRRDDSALAAELSGGDLVGTAITVVPGDDGPASFSLA
ncbi:MAG: acetyl-CoA acetyltransferase [Acidimicrobiales bacterium]|nr:acetyl-CoA acetyltransferase [Acidimicrobiales bacterium]